MLSPLLYALFTRDCLPIHAANTITKFADDTTVMGLITNKTKEIEVDFRKAKRTDLSPVFIDGEALERVSSFKFLRTHITKNFSWAKNSFFAKVVKRLNMA